MGMFDRVWVACPACGYRNEHQSKAGECGLYDYEVVSAPTEVAADVAGQKICENCEADYTITVQALVGVTRS